MTIASIDASYRKVLLSSAALKHKLAALQNLERPTQSFLSRLLRDSDLPAKLRLAVTDRLKELRRKKEIDRILAAETVRLEGRS